MVLYLHKLTKSVTSGVTIRQLVRKIEPGSQTVKLDNRKSSRLAGKSRNQESPEEISGETKMGPRGKPSFFKILLFWRTRVFFDELVEPSFSPTINMKEQKEGIIPVAYQTRFERWASEDTPIIIKPETIAINCFCDSDLESLAEIYRSAFNAQNQRLYQQVRGAKLIWDEEPWTPESSKSQVEEELSTPGVICLIARAENQTGQIIVVGFIIARPIDQAVLTSICGSTDVSEAITLATCYVYPLLLWEDAACFNLINPDGQTIRGVGTKLYSAMAETADSSGLMSIGRTSPGSYAEKILPKVGFAPFIPPIQDGKDKQRYWLIRKNDK